MEKSTTNLNREEIVKRVMRDALLRGIIGMNFSRDNSSKLFERIKEYEFSEDEYDFQEMIEEFEKGYTGLFTDEKWNYTYDKESGTLLLVSGSGSFPAKITSELFTKMFKKVEEEKFDGVTALELIKKGDRLNFELELGEGKWTGKVDLVDGSPRIRIDNDKKCETINPNYIMAAAFLTGTWTLCK
jgi:hypothetical protein